MNPSNVRTGVKQEGRKETQKGRAGRDPRKQKKKKKKERTRPSSTRPTIISILSFF
jgi:hypothetical protein